ncbi:PHOCN protein, partial [Atractosteus spatula]|nr:PHOCN protein [Atractosteus spatula]
MVMAEGAAVLRRNRPGTKAQVRVRAAGPDRAGRREGARRVAGPAVLSCEGRRVSDLSVRESSNSDSSPAGGPGPFAILVPPPPPPYCHLNTWQRDFYNWPDESFEEMDSTLAVQQYIQQNIRSDCSNIDKILEPPEGQDEGVWKYEHLRQFCLELNGLAVKLQVLCAHACPCLSLSPVVCVHWLRPVCLRRVSIKESSVAKLGSVCRRIYRIFSHAYFHHRQIFDKYENETFLCHRFTRFVMKYNLMSKDNLIVPILEEEVQSAASGESEA